MTRRVATRAVAVALRGSSGSGRGHVERVGGGLHVAEDPLDESDGVSKGTEGTVAGHAEQSTDGAAMTCR